MLTQLLTQFAAADHAGAFADCARLYLAATPVGREQLEALVAGEFGLDFLSDWRRWRRVTRDREI